MSAHVDFCGESYEVPPEGMIRIGREGDIVIDDNPYLHRQFLQLAFCDNLLWLSNVGSATTATLSDLDGFAQSWLSPGARMPLVFPRTVVWFTAGPTTYEMEVVLDAPLFVTPTEPGTRDGETTMGRITFTSDQRLLILALAEDILRRGNRGAGAIPHSTTAAARLGWTMTKFNRKLDNVCEKLSRIGVRGLVGDGHRSASNRRATLVEYVLAARIITGADLHWLDVLDSQRPSPR